MVDANFPVGVRGHTKVWKKDSRGIPVMIYQSACTCDLCEDKLPLQEIKSDVVRGTGAWLCDDCAKRVGYSW